MSSSADPQTEDEDPLGRNLLQNPCHKQSLSEFLTAEYSVIRSSVLADVTLYCNSTEFKAHRIVLSHYSDFFRHIFESVGGGTKHFDVYLEGFDEQQIERVLTFCYTGAALVGGGRRELEIAADALQIPSLSNFLRETSDTTEEHNGKNQQSRDDDDSSETWQRNNNEPPDELPIFEDDDDEESWDYDPADKRTSEGEHSSCASKRRKQARPQRHKPTPPNSNRSQSPDEILSLTDEEDNFDTSFEDEDLQEDLPSQTPPPPPHPQQIPPPPPSSSPHHGLQQHARLFDIPPQAGGAIPVPPPPPPPHFLFLRNMINPNGPPPNPPPPQYFAAAAAQHHVQGNKKLGCGPKGLWGKLMSKGGSGGGGGGALFHHHHHHGSSRAQHSAPRGGPPRAWSNQDLTEALHNVWNKKMTTSQASRIFGIPYNSLLMYVRGKYGKSLKLDLLKKGLDLALLEKQKQIATGQQQQQNGTTNPSSSSSTCSSSATTQPPAAPQQQPHKIEWMMSGGGNKIPLDQRLFHAGMYVHEHAFGRKQEIGK